MPPQIRYVALYCRISKDKSGRMEGVQLQEGWGREYAARTWPGVPIKVFTDNNLSGHDESRPGYIELCRAIDRGEIAHLWAVEQSRFARNEQMWFGLEGRLINAGIKEVHVQRGGPIIQCGSVTGGILAVVYASERRTMLLRQSEKFEAKAAEGRPAGANPFGYKRGTDADGGKTYIVVPDQAAAIRFAAEKILAGWSLSNVAKHLREKQGIKGVHRRHVRDEDGNVVETRSTAIRATTVRYMVTNYAVAGLRLNTTCSKNKGHDGRCDDNCRETRTYKGVWEPILDMATWEAVRAKLGESRVLTRPDGSTYNLKSVRRETPRRKYLLTGGLAVCGVCGAPLIATVKQLRRQRATSKPFYLCHPKVGGKGCVTILGDELQQHVVNYFLGLLRDPEFLDGLKDNGESAARRDELVTTLDGIRAEKKALARMRGLGEIDDDEWQELRHALTEREHLLQAELVDLPSPESIIDLTRVPANWEVMNLDARRAALGMLVGRVTVHRARLGLRAYDPERVKIELLDSVRLPSL